MKILKDHLQLFSATNTIPVNLKRKERNNGSSYGIVKKQRGGALGSTGKTHRMDFWEFPPMEPSKIRGGVERGAVGFFRGHYSLSKRTRGRSERKIVFIMSNEGEMPSP